jgi:enhancing lycopene biosynthesis protein 2
MPTCAIILCGCGRADGSEIHESVSILQHLARLGASYLCFAPDQPQAEVVNHFTGLPEGAPRNALVESARIARGQIAPITACRAADFDALFFPGGFGAAKNLCTFAKDGTGMTVHPEVQRLLREFHGAGKPIALCCIAPVLAARVLPGVTVTLGAEGDAPAAARAWGAHHQAAPVDQCIVDARNKVVTTPAYMYGDANPWQVSVGIGHMVEATLKLAQGTPWAGPDAKDNAMNPALWTATTTAAIYSA